MNGLIIANIIVNSFLLLCFIIHIFFLCNAEDDSIQPKNKQNIDDLISDKCNLSVQNFGLRNELQNLNYKCSSLTTENINLSKQIADLKQINERLYKSNKNLWNRLKGGK